MGSDQQRQRNCVTCGRAIDWNANICQYCGHDYRLPSPGHPQVSQPLQGQNNITLIVALVVIVAIVVAAALVASVVLGPEADLRADLSYYAENDWLGLASSGSITVSGTIYNYGDKNGGGTVHLQIYDGYTWHYYDVATGVVPAGGSVDFYWSGAFDPMIDDNVQVRHSLTTG